MHPRRLPFLLGLAMLAALLVPSADAKFRVSTTIVPARPIAGSPARLILQPEIAVARKHGIRLFAVAPWRSGTGR